MGTVQLFHLLILFTIKKEDLAQNYLISISHHLDHIVVGLREKYKAIYVAHTVATVNNLHPKFLIKHSHNLP